MGNDVGRRIAAARRDRGWDQTELARRAGVAGSYISRLENGKFASPSAVRLARIADALGRRMTDLTEPPPAPEEAEEAALRRQIEQLGVVPDNAELVDYMVQRLRGRGPVNREAMTKVFDVLLDALPPAP